MLAGSSVLPQREGSLEALTSAFAKVGAFKLPVIPFRRLHFELTSQSIAHLSEFKGSMLRGAFGHALRRSVCAMRAEQPCETCSLRTACAHAKLFETFIEGEPPPFFKGLEQAPRQLTFQMIRRVLETASFHVPEVVEDWNFRSLLDHADSIEIDNVLEETSY